MSALDRPDSDPGADFVRIEAAFDRAVLLGGPERSAVLDEVLADRADLRAQVEALLDAHDALPPVEPELTTRPLGVGARVGPYRLVEKIGEGGMGEVYRAERVEGGFTQEVAVKVTRAMLRREDLSRRFWLERQILASLAHPNIVSIVDGGATEDGQAYYVMEYVAGQPITHYCREHRLPLTRRLELMGTICGAVQYAHQRGIVHRDLKPANILVKADGTPKVLDFGVAKLLHEPVEDTGTQTGLLPGPLTPNYASPEQLRGLAATTASDVYALGVLLYELVAGVRPYHTEGKTLDRVIEIVLHEEPPRPSATSSADLPYAPSLLRGDLDAIVAKAMHKDAAERYDSAAQLAADLSRALHREPVMARPSSASYVLRRMAERHKAAFAIGVAALIAVIGASAAALWQRQVAVREQQRAEQVFRDGRQLANALVFKVHDAVAKLPGSTEVRKTIVQDAVQYLERLEAQSVGDREMRLELANAFGQIAGILGDPQRANLGDRDGAVLHYQKSHELAKELLESGPVSFEVIGAYARAGQRLSTLAGLKGDAAAAVSMAQDVVDRVTRYTDAHPDDARGPKLLAESNFYLAWALPDPESVAVWERAMAYYDAELEKEPHSAEHRRNAALMRKYLSATLVDLGRPDEAEPQFRRALELDELRLAVAPDDRQTRLDAAISNGQMGQFLQRSGNLTEAVELFARSVSLLRLVVEADPKDVMARERLSVGLLNLGRAHRQLANVLDARLELREALALQEEVVGVTGDLKSRPQLAQLWSEIGEVEEQAQQWPAACRAYRRAAELFIDVEAVLTDADKARLENVKAKISECGEVG